MKNLFIQMLAAGFLFLAGSCSSSKKLNKATGAREIILPLNGKEYQSDRSHFRAKQSGKSPDLALAKKIALQNANAELAGIVSKTVKRVMDQYTNQRSVGTVQEYENKVEELAREVVNQNMQGVRMIGEKVYQEEDKSYTYWVAVELSMKDIEDAAANRLSK
ncbi:MAG: hypothetical protein LW707_10195, partial [Sphingobacteriales bacterium]|nr:hypothetical protein [Sphingobacteriales bacterium]